MRKLTEPGPSIEGVSPDKLCEFVRDTMVAALGGHVYVEAVHIDHAGILARASVRTVSCNREAVITIEIR